MFWRMWFRWLTVRRPQALLALVSLAVGATVASTLIDLYGGVRRKMTEEFRAYGANIVLAPTSAGRSSLPEDVTPLMDAGVLSRIEELRARIPGLIDAPMLDVVALVSRVPAGTAAYGGAEEAVAVGTNLAAFQRLNPGWHVQQAPGAGTAVQCAVGARLAQRLGLHVGESIEVSTLGSESRAGGRWARFWVSEIVASGASEDDQVLLPLDSLQRLTGLAGKISVVELSVPADAATVASAVNNLSRMLPGVDVRPLRQIAEPEGRVLMTIRGLLISLTTLVLGIVVLCVMSTMTVILLERRRDVAVMKSLGATAGLVSRLVLAEVATLGLLGGLVGFALGAVVASDLGRQLFGVRLVPLWWTLPVLCAASVLVTIASTALPLGTVRSVDPAAVLRGE
jgi:putative ABC transport system permease protein